MPCGLPASSGLRSITAGGYTRCWADGSRAPLQGLRASRALVPVSTYRQRARQLGSRPHASPSYTTHHALGISSSHSPRVVEVAAAPIFLVCCKESTRRAPRVLRRIPLARTVLMSPQSACPHHFNSIMGIVVAGPLCFTTQTGIAARPSTTLIIDGSPTALTMLRPRPAR